MCQKFDLFEIIYCHLVSCYGTFFVDLEEQKGKNIAIILLQVEEIYFLEDKKVVTFWRHWEFGNKLGD